MKQAVNNLSRPHKTPLIRCKFVAEFKEFLFVERVGLRLGNRH